MPHHRVYLNTCRSLLEENGIPVHEGKSFKMIIFGESIPMETTVRRYFRVVPGLRATNYEVGEVRARRSYLKLTRQVFHELRVLHHGGQ